MGREWKPASLQTAENFRRKCEHKQSFLDHFVLIAQLNVLLMMFIDPAFVGSGKCEEIIEPRRDERNGCGIKAQSLAQ